MLKDHTYSNKKPTNVFKDPQGMCFSFSDWPGLLCEKQDGQESAIDPVSIPDFDEIEQEVLCSKMPGITRARGIEEYKKARLKISQNQSVVFADLAYDLLVNTEYDNYQLVNNFEDSPNWMKAINKLAINIKRIVLKDYVRDCFWINITFLPLLFFTHQIWPIIEGEKYSIWVRKNICWFSVGM